MANTQLVTRAREVENLILLIRGQRVMLDSDLARIYRTPTKRLNEQVRRNRKRFPPDFMFQLTDEEAHVLRSQIATSKPGSGGRRYNPHAFTEHGAVMLATILNSPVAVKASIHVVRAFVRLRLILSTHKDLALKLENMEKKYDSQFRVVFQAIRELMAKPTPARQRIGF